MAVPSTNVFPSTGIPALELILSGYEWKFPGERVIHWSISDSLDGKGWPNPDAIVQALDLAFSNIASYIDVKFEYVGHFSDPEAAYAGDSDINIAIDFGIEVDIEETAANARYPGLYPQDYEGAPGDIFVNHELYSDPLHFERGTINFHILIHEIGHALGLKHTHEQEGSGLLSMADLGLEHWDRNWYSVMSYGYDYENFSRWHCVSPMALDIIGLQHMYGVNQENNTADDTHRLRDTSSYFTLWDAGGEDTISLAGNSEGWTVQLPDPPGRDGIPVPEPVEGADRMAYPHVGHAYISDETDLPSPYTLYWLMGEYEHVIGSAYDDTVYGGGGDETFTLGRGDDYLDGGDGMDVAVYGEILFGHTIARHPEDASGLYVVTGPRGRDELVNIERIQFAGNDGVALDLFGTAGQAYRIYRAAFDREPDHVGLGFWIARMDNGMEVEEVSARFIDSEEFRGLYGDAPTDEEFLTALYANVLDREPDGEGYEWWLDQMRTNPDRTRDKVLAEFSESPENRSNVQEEILDGIHYDIWLA